VLVETAARGINHRDSGGSESPDADGQIIIVRPHVVDTVGHVLGNLFQRIYHLIDRVRKVEASASVQLEESTRQLEDFLQLALDYFSPLALTLQYVPGTEVAQSLARQLSDAVGCPVKIDVKLPLDGRLLVDPGLLTRGFGLLATQLRENPQSDTGLELKAVAREPRRALVFSVVIPPQLVAVRSSQLEMRWAVAEKFLEVHGGAVQQTTTGTGEVLWEIVLPLQS